MKNDKQGPVGLYEKLAAIRDTVQVLTKNKKAYAYNFVTEDQILAKMQAAMKNFKVVLTLQMVPGKVFVEPIRTTESKTDKAGNVTAKEKVAYFVHGEILYTWTDLETNEHLEVPWIITATKDDPSLAVGGAITYFQRYFLMKFFQCATTDGDPDSWYNENRAAEDEINAEVLQKTIESITKYVTACLDSCKNQTEKAEKREKISIVVQRFVTHDGKPSANYRYLTDVDTATRLLAAIKQQCEPSGEK